MKIVNLKVENGVLSAVSRIDDFLVSETPYINFHITFTDTTWNYATRLALLYECDKEQTMVPITSNDNIMPAAISKQRYFTMRVIGLSGDARMATNKIFVEQGEL